MLDTMRPTPKHPPNRHTPYTAHPPPIDPRHTQTAEHWVKAGASYCVPFCTCTYGQLTALLTGGKNPVAGPYIDTGADGVVSGSLASQDAQVKHAVSSQV